jgi:hypothetical protein
MVRKAARRNEKGLSQALLCKLKLKIIGVA